MKKKKIIIIIFAFLAVVSACILAWYLYQNRWSTYRDEELGFKIKYPNEYFVYKNPLIPDVQLRKITSESGKTFAWTMLDVEYNTLNKALCYNKGKKINGCEDRVEAGTYFNDEEAISEGFSISDITINNYPAKKYIHDCYYFAFSGPCKPLVRVAIFSDEKQYLINFMWTKDPDDIRLNVINSFSLLED